MAGNERQNAGYSSVPDAKVAKKEERSGTEPGTSPISGQGLKPVCKIELLPGIPSEIRDFVDVNTTGGLQCN